MSINQLDCYTVDSIANLLDIQTLHNFSRTCKTFKEICHQLDNRKRWQKDVYSVFLDAVFDHMDSSNDEILRNLTNIEACLNTFQYTSEVKANIISRLENRKHSSEVIDFILTLSEVLSNHNYNDHSVLLFESVENNDPLGGPSVYDGFEALVEFFGKTSIEEKESGFSCKIFEDDDSTKLDHIYIEDVSEIDDVIMQRTESYFYYKIEKAFDVKVLQDKEFKELCCEIRKLTNLHGTQDTVIAEAFVTLFSESNESLPRQETKTSRILTEQELSLITNRLQVVQNCNIKSLLLRTEYLKTLVQYINIFSHFVSKQVFKEFIKDLTNFLKLFPCRRLTESHEALLANIEYTKFLLISSYVVPGERIIYEENDDDLSFTFSGYYLVGNEQVHLLYSMDPYQTLECTINDIEIDSAVLLNYDPMFLMFFPLNHEQILAVNQAVTIIKDFIENNFKRNNDEVLPVVTSQFVIAFFNVLYYVNQPIAYNYNDYYHMTVVKHPPFEGGPTIDFNELIKTIGQSL